MNNTTKRILVILLIIQISFTSNTFAQKKRLRSEFSIENNAIPANFGKEETVLVAILHPKNKKYNKNLTKALEENYGGEYVMSRSSMLTEKYSDREKYRYTFNNMYIFDRLTGQEYSCGTVVSNYIIAINIYLENLEKIRQSNKSLR